MAQSDVPKAKAKRKKDHPTARIAKLLGCDVAIVNTVSKVVLVVLLLSAWLLWIVVPVHWLVIGRSIIKDTWTPVNCTIIAQSCYKGCKSGSSCAENCCRDADDCIRSQHFLSANCVWLSTSLYEQLPNYGAKVNIRDWKEGKKQPISHSKPCLDAKHVASMTVEHNGTIITQNVACHFTDGRDICRAEELRHRDRRCSTPEDLEQRSFCAEDFVNRVGKQHQCYVHPQDPTKLTISGTKNAGDWTFFAIYLWAAFTFFLCSVNLAARARERKSTIWTGGSLAKKESLEKVGSLEILAKKGGLENKDKKA
mmetsp:Transcript_32923/g.77574  ORF Transcript_32923/g.77574 Transcript_32923/m.77574 type:complete len:310 (-) Transcript_32923:73-1002(-)